MRYWICGVKVFLHNSFLRISYFWFGPVTRHHRSHEHAAYLLPIEMSCVHWWRRITARWNGIVHGNNLPLCLISARLSIAVLQSSITSWAIARKKWESFVQKLHHRRHGNCSFTYFSWSSLSATCCEWGWREVHLCNHKIDVSMVCFASKFSTRRKWQIVKATSANGLTAKDNLRFSPLWM